MENTQGQVLRGCRLIKREVSASGQAVSSRQARRMFSDRKTKLSCSYKVKLVKRESPSREKKPTARRTRKFLRPDDKQKVCVRKKEGG